jgi:hypothetical protein
MPENVSPTRNICLKPKQWQVYQDPSRFKILVTGRRFGKTYYLLTTLITEAANNPGGLYWYTAPTYRQAKAIAWRMLGNLMPKEWIAKDNISELSVTMTNGSVIELKGVDQPDSLVGVGVYGAALDECALYPTVAPWEVAIRPTLADIRTKHPTQGWAIFATTIRPGLTAAWFLKLYKKMQKEPLPNWKTWTFTTLEGGNVSEEELEAARLEMDPVTFRREFEATLEDTDGRVAVCFSDDNICEVEDNERSALFIGIDFNINPLTASFGVKHRVEVENGVDYDEMHVFQEITLLDATTWMLADAINNIFGLGRKKIACPDPSGVNRSTSASSPTTSDHSILRQAGMRVRVPAKNRKWRIRDKILAVNTALLDATGRRRLKIHPRCEQTIESLRNLAYDEKTGLPDKTQGYDHRFDNIGYLCLSAFNLSVVDKVERTNVKVYGSGGEEKKKSYMPPVGMVA